MSDNNYSQISEFTFVKSVTITPSNDTVLACSGVFIEGGGTIALQFEDDTIDTWTVPNFYRIEGQIKRVRATGTTATGIHAIY
jgi:hypothetical protein